MVISSFVHNLMKHLELQNTIFDRKNLGIKFYIDLSNHVVYMYKLDKYLKFCKKIIIF